MVFRHWNYQNPIILARDIKHCVHTSQLCDANCSDSCLWLFITWNAFLWLYIYIVRPKQIIPAIYCTFEYILGTILYFVEYLYSIQLIYDCCKGRNQFYFVRYPPGLLEYNCGTIWVHPGYNLSTIWVQSYGKLRYFLWQTCINQLYFVRYPPGLLEYIAWYNLGTSWVHPIWVQFYGNFPKWTDFYMLKMFVIRST